MKEMISNRLANGRAKEILDTLDNATHTSEDSESECVICMLPFKKGDEKVKTACDHTYHRGCLEKWIPQKATCPMCREPLAEDEDDEILREEIVAWLRQFLLTR